MLFLFIIYSTFTIFDNFFNFYYYFLEKNGKNASLLINIH